MLDIFLKFYHRCRYHLKLSLQSFLATLISQKIKNRDSLPPVTLFISSFNTLYPLQVTLASLEKTNQKRDHLIIADNQSTDGSLEFLREYAKKRAEFNLLRIRP